MPTSDHAHPKIIEITFSFPKFAPAWKISFHSIHSFLRYSQFQRPVTRLTMSIFDMSTQKKFDQILIYVNLYQHAKNQAIYMVDWKILQSGWLRTFWSISQEQKFSQIWDLFRNTANNISFHYTIKPVKINDHIFQYIQKNPVFGPFLVHFYKFWGKKFFSGKSSSVTHNFIWVSSTMPKFRKNERYNSKKTPGQKDGQTLFYRTLLATAGGPKRDCHAWKFSELPLCRNFRGGYTFFMCCVKPAIEKFTFPEKQLFFFSNNLMESDLLITSASKISRNIATHFKAFGLFSHRRN